MTALSASTVSSLSLPTPTYDRAQARVGIVHFGLGNFHRSHQAMYLDRLMNTGSGLDWGICGIGMKPGDRRKHQVLIDQDGLYTLVLRHPDGSLEGRVIGSVLEHRIAPDDPEAVYARLVDPAVRIVTLTVTEGGYLVDPATRAFNAGDPSVVHDVADRSNPQTSFGYLIEALRRRREAGIPPFTILSCDNLQGNGHYAHQAVVEMARLIDPDFAEWIDENVAFPSSMVDRITPVTTDDDRAAVTATFGIEDGWPVPAEPFTQWIVEDDFPMGRPPLEEVGVQFVEDVKPYELMKLRLLNGSHQALAYLGAPLGYELVDEAMADEHIYRFLDQYMRREAVPTLPPLPGFDLDGYIQAALDRFSNPKMRDTILRLAQDSSNRVAGFVLPTVRANLEEGRRVPLGAAIVAAWSQYWQLIGKELLPKSQVPEDVLAKEMTHAAMQWPERPLAFLEIEQIFGDLVSYDAFVHDYIAARTWLDELGVHETIDALLA